MAGSRREGRRGRKPGWSTAAQEIVDRLFVYGNLRSGQAARSLIAEHVARAEPATTKGRIYAFSDGYPGFVPGEEGRVVGEVVHLRDLASVFPLLDAFEGDSYARIMAKATLADGREEWTWVFALADASLADHAEHVESGDWVAWLASESAGQAR